MAPIFMNHPNVFSNFWEAHKHHASLNICGKHYAQGAVVAKFVLNPITNAGFIFTYVHYILIRSIIYGWWNERSL